MLEHTKRQVDMIKTNMFITAVCILFLIKLRWPSNYNKSLNGLQVGCPAQIQRHFKENNVNTIYIMKSILKFLNI